MGLGVKGAEFSVQGLGFRGEGVLVHAVHHPREVAHLFRDCVNGFNRMIDSGRSAPRAENAQGTPTQRHISPSI